MKLYYSPGACSLSPHIALHEAGLAFEPVIASTKTHQLEDGTDYYSINPLGYVPMLELDDGTRLTEGPTILQYIADQVPTKGLAPVAGTLARYRLQSWLNLIGTEIHKGFSPFFNPNLPAESKALFKPKLMARLKYIDGELATKNYLTGENYTVADGYLYAVTRWAKRLEMDISEFKNLAAFMKRVGDRPAVKAALKTENLEA